MFDWIPEEDALDPLTTVKFMRDYIAELWLEGISKEEFLDWVIKEKAGQYVGDDGV